MKIETIKAVKGVRVEEISKEEVVERLENGWIITVKVNLGEETGFLVLDDDGIDVIALKKDVIDKLREKKDEVLTILGFSGSF